MRDAQNRFDVLADYDVDGATFQIGLRHYPIGPARPAICINTGAVELLFNVHQSDIDVLIAGCKAAKRALKKAHP